MADDLKKKEMMMKNAGEDPATSLISRTTMQKELGLDPNKEYNLKEQELKHMIELKVKSAEGEAEAQGTATVINAMYMADAELANRSKSEKNEREFQEEREKALADQKSMNAEGVAQETEQISSQKGIDATKISIPNLIMTVTSRFARLAEINPNEFKVRMLAMKNSMPSLFLEVVNNLKEMNVILADTTPDLETVQKYTPGQIPSAAQGDTYSEEPPSPAEAGADPSVSALPEQRPPRGPSTQI